MRGYLARENGAGRCREKNRGKKRPEAEREMPYDE